MAKRLFLVDIDLGGNHLVNAAFEVLSSDPVSPVTGRAWLNSSTSKLKYNDGAAVQTFAELSTTLDQFGAPAGALSMGNQRVTNVATPTATTDAVPKSYVDALAASLSIRDSVVAATASALPANTYNNGTSGVGATITGNANGSNNIDGVTPSIGDRILVKNEATQANNGIFIVTAVGDGSHPFLYTRATDFDQPAEMFRGTYTLAESGTANQATGWVFTTSGTVTVGTTAIVFTQFSSSSIYTAAVNGGLTLTGTAFSVNVDGVTTDLVTGSIVVRSTATSGQVLRSTGTAGAAASWGALDLSSANAVANQLPISKGGTGAATAAAARTALSVPTKFAATIGDGSSTSIVVNHALGTQDVQVQVFQVGSPLNYVGCEIDATDANNVTLAFAVAPSTNSLRVVVIG